MRTVRDPPAKLVDENGAAVANTRGILITQKNQTIFDCARDIGCSDGHLIELDALFWNDDIDHAQIHFQRDDGTLGPAQEIKPISETKTDPDYNGRGCPCTWTETKTDPIVVPDDARAPTGQVEVIRGEAGANGTSG